MKAMVSPLGCLVLLGLLFGCAEATKPEEQTPNIILFFVDDLGWQDTSVPFWDRSTPLNSIYHTPNMERLAEQGVKFTQAYATPVCSPSRVSLMTGMNAARHRVTNWTLQPDKLQPMELNHPTLDFPQWNFNGITTHGTVANAVHATPLPQLLYDQGYHTIHVGKAHFGALSYPTANPTALGFKVNIAGHAAGAPGSYLGTENFGHKKEGRAIWAVPGLEDYHGQDIFLTQALTNEALAALEVPIKRKQPFFLYFSPYGVHTPLMADPRFVKKYKEMGLPPSEVKYASMIESMDYALGQLMDFVARKNMEDNTIILFMSDNGGLSAVARDGEKHTHNAPLNSGKGAIYEGGIRVPMLVKWPKKSPPKSINHTPVIIEDFFPSLIEMAGIEEVTTVQTVDGKSFVSGIKNPKRKASKDRALFWHYPNDWGPEGPGIGSFSAVRKGDWKLIYFHDDQHFELYNIKEDIGETNNVFDTERSTAFPLAEELTDYLKGVNAQMPRFKTTQKNVPWPAELF